MAYHENLIKSNGAISAYRQRTRQVIHIPAMCQVDNVCDNIYGNILCRCVLPAVLYFLFY